MDAMINQAMEETRRLVNKALEAATRGDHENAAQAVREAAQRLGTLAAVLAVLPGGKAATKHIQRMLTRAADEIEAGRAGRAAGLLRTALQGLQHGLLSAAARKQRQDSMSLSR